MNLDLFQTLGESIQQIVDAIRQIKYINNPYILKGYLINFK